MCFQYVAYIFVLVIAKHKGSLHDVDGMLPWLYWLYDLT
jgi:hypothetical protein